MRPTHAGSIANSNVLRGSQRLRGRLVLMELPRGDSCLYVRDVVEMEPASQPP